MELLYLMHAMYIDKGCCIR